MESVLVLIPLALLIGATVNGACALARTRGARLPDGLVSLVACLAPAVAFGASLWLFGDLDSHPESRVSTVVFDWFGAGNIDLPFKLAADHLTAVMMLVVTGIGTLIHIYSTGYMKGDPGYARFFACLNLFTFFMSILVLGGNMPVLFMGWEGVGLCSYLLIGFWWTDSDKAAAGMKAFVVNRIGDAGFLLGMFVLWTTLGTLDFTEMADPTNVDKLTGTTGFFGATVATLAGILLFVGATGKSAQMPLYVWLPDAMAGPTPVSALIHAATMVTAGVYMIARMSFVYGLSPVAQGLVVLVAGFTCLFAGVMAMTQFDIKKVLAYSTISQIGYMMIGVGTGFIGAGIFHVVTHAFFKASLFLGAGTVINQCHHEQDMRKMGGLARRMPWTCLTMVVAAAAMAGIPPLSGFFSKDEVLWRAFSSGTLPGKMAWLFGMLCAGCTGFYMFRLVFMTFAGTYRGHHPPKEAPAVMTVPQGLLAVGAVFVGFLGVPHILGGHDQFGTYVNAVVPAFAMPEAHHGSGSEMAVEWALMIWSVLFGVSGICTAWWLYIRRPDLPGRIVARIPRLYARVNDKFRVDEFYVRTVVDPTRRAAQRFWSDRVDQGVIEGIINGLGRFARGLGGWLSRGQAGLIRAYVAMMVVGVLVFLLTMLGS